MYTVSIYSNGSGDNAFEEKSKTKAIKRAKQLLEEITEQKTSIGTYEYNNGTEIIVEDDNGNEVEKFIIER